jgi:hypothetical protein
VRLTSKRTVPSPTKVCCSWQQSPRQQQEIRHDFKYSSQNTSLESDSEIVDNSSLQRPTLSSERQSSTISRSTVLYALTEMTMYISSRANSIQVFLVYFRISVEIYRQLSEDWAKWDLLTNGSTGKKTPFLSPLNEIVAMSNQTSTVCLMAWLHAQMTSNIILAQKTYRYQFRRYAVNL